MPTPDTQHTDEPTCTCGLSLDRLNVVERSGLGDSGYYSTLDLVCECGRVHDQDDVAAMYDALDEQTAAA